MVLKLYWKVIEVVFAGLRKNPYTVILKLREMHAILIEWQFTKPHLAPNSVAESIKKLDEMLAGIHVA